MRTPLLAALVLSLVVAESALAQGSTPAILIFFDVSASLLPEERVASIVHVKAVLGGLKAGTAYAVFPVQLHTEENSPAILGSVPTSTSRLKERSDREQWAQRVEELGSTLSALQKRDEDFETDNRSCIADSLRVAEKYFREYPAGSYRRELIYISDMVEECESGALGSFDLSKKDIAADIARVKNVDAVASLEDVAVTVIVPSAALSPDRG